MYKIWISLDLGMFRHVVKLGSYITVKVLNLLKPVDKFD